MMRSKNAASTTAYAAVGPSRYHWQPGFKHLPWKGLGALLISLAGVVVSIAILLASDGDDVRRWKFPPTVYLSIASTVSNITHTYALFEGITVAWWHKALKDGTNVGDLHRIWAYGNSFLSAIWAGRHFNLIALACILVAISPINGPLLQRASTLTNGTVSAQQEFNVEVNKLVPRGFTGIITGRGNDVNMLRTDFAPIARGYFNRDPIALKSECTGTCRTNLLGAGFHANCSSYRQPLNVTETEELLPATIFEVGILYEVSSTGQTTTATLNVAYKPQAGCIGELLVTNCTLRGGTVQYPIVIDGPTSTVALAPNSTIWDDVTIGVPDNLPYEDHLTGITTYGGIFLALANQYNTGLSLRFAGGIGFEFDGAQSEASIAYARDVGTYPSCNITFTNPLPDFLQGTRELIFRTAVLSANSSNSQHVLAQASGSHTIYKTDWLFLGLATLASLLAIVSVLLTFHGFWTIGRHVSMSPIETGKAFNAPLLRGGNANAPARHLLKQVGPKPVKYGVVGNSRSGAESAASTEGSMYRDSPYGDHIPDTAYSPHVQRRQTYRQPPGSDFELLSPGEGAAAANARLELADPKIVTPL